jgi:transcriptional regulator with XRE-family HTH domain
VITGSQLRAARGLLNLSVAEMSELTGLAVNTIRKAESTNGVPAINAANIKVLSGALEAEGVIFIPADDLGPGVRISDPLSQPMRHRRREAIAT